MENENLIILNKIQQGIILLDDKFNIVIWNQWIEDLSGINKVDVINKSIYEIIHLFNNTIYKNIFKDALEEGLNRFCSGGIHNTFIYPKDYNKSKFYKQSMQVEQVTINNKQYIMLQIKDVTVEYERINKLRNNIRELNKQKKIADEANKAKSIFLANMSHEIRTPLNGIVGYLHLLENTDLNMEQKSSVEIIKNSTNILMNTINDILDMSKIEANKLELENIEFDLITVIRESILPFTAIAKQKSIDINMQISPSVPRFVTGDPAKLKQVIMNLVGNAVKFTNIGYVNLKVYINVTALNKNEIIFIVEDTGMGIAKESIDNLFKPFTQADISATRKFGGTGLGLSICKSIVELMNGKISVQSEEGKGAKFTFSVMLKKVEMHENTIDNHKFEEDTISETTELDVNYKKIQILLVEDNEINRKLFIKLLQLKGLKCDVAFNGEECIKACTEKIYDIIFMDCQMPVMDGYEATQKLRQMEGDKRHTIIIAMTASAMKEDEERCLNIGMDEYISKPIDINKTMSLIEKYAKVKNSNYFTEVVLKLMRDTGFDKTSSEEIVRDFCTESKSMILSIKKYIYDENLDEAGKLLHQLKGSSGSIRANEISKKVSEAEGLIRSKENRELKKLIDDIEKLITKLSMKLND